MKTSTDYRISTAFAALLVGEPKTGKTNLSMAFPSPWFLDLDGNIASAVRRAPGKRFFFDDLKGVPAIEVFEKLETLIKAASADSSVETIIIDSLTSLVGIVREHILTRLRANGAKLRTDTLDDQLRLSDYQTLSTYILRLLALCRASGKYVIWTAHQKADRDELTGIVKYQLHIPGNLKDNLGAYFTDVWATVVEPVMTAKGSDVKYTIRTKPTGLHISLGASFPMEASTDVTNKTPEQIWTAIGPKLK